MKVEITEPTLKGLEEYRNVSDSVNDDIESLVNAIVRLWLVDGGWCKFETIWPKSEEID